METTEVKESASIPTWAKQAHEAWQSAIEATRQFQEVYNQWLSKVDQIHAIPTLEQSVPELKQIQKDMNQLYDLSESYQSGVLTRVIEPFLKQQKEFNARAVHLLNELLDYFATSSNQLRELLMLQVQYFQQITPWIDAKIQELRMEENHNVTYHIGSIQRNLDAITIQQHALQSQLKQEENRLEEVARKLEEQLKERAAGFESKLTEAFFGIERKKAPHVTPEIYELNRIQIELEDLKRQVSLQPQSSSVQSEISQAVPKDRDADFRYHVFEQIFRGSSDALKEAQKRYLPFFESSPEPILDIGCGRGEFLQLMKEAGKEAYGIDLNEHGIDLLKASGLNAVATDIYSHLKNLDKESIGGVFCAQVVEHLEPDAVYQILKSLNRAMKPGAPLIIETVNPLSIFGFHNLYFKDPTHIFPVHPETLIFMMRYSGFQDIKLELTTPVPVQQTLPLPKKEHSDPALFEYLKGIITQLNHLLYEDLEYYVVGFHS